ncbi:MAG: hypothetical protein H8K04_07130 [Nitrospira sp.]
MIMCGGLLALSVWNRIVEAVAATYAMTGGDSPYRASMQAIVATGRAAG